MRLLVALVIWTGAVLGAVEVSSVVAKSIHNKPAAAAGGGSFTASGGGAGSSTASGGGTSVDPSKVGATDRVSLFRAATLSRALAAARAQLGADARIDNFALYPGYLALTAVKGGNEVEFYVDVNGRSSRTTSSGAAGSDALFSLAHVKPGVPDALARRIATSGHMPASALHYMVAQVDPISHRFRWL